MKMEGIRHGFCLTLWICFLSATRAKDSCTGRSIPSIEHTVLPSDLKDSYSHEETLRLSCKFGYTGIQRITCNDGTWKKSGRHCQPKQCGHPGDAINGDFTLSQGTDFVFGSQVLYTCKTGYKLAGKINHRNCMDQGWDNAVPICEVVKCPPIEQAGDVIATGNTDHPQFGDVIQFECRDSDFKLDTEQNQIHCTEDGVWSTAVPKCIEVICEPPEIPNGKVTSPERTMKKNAILSFACNEQYKAVGRPSSTCTNDGWIPKPQCTEISCEVPQLSDIRPQTKIMYLPDETATVVCKNGFRTSSKKAQDTATCQKNGQWSIAIYCEEITCHRTQADNVASWPRYSNYIFREQASPPQGYTCRQGYRKSEYPTCQIEGWVPPLCQAITCDPNIPNAVVLSGNIQYVFGDRLEYKCNRFYMPEGTQVTYCQERGWANQPNCQAMKSTCLRPVFDHGYVIPDDSIYEDASVIHYACDPGYKPVQEGWWGELTCRQGKWSHTPQCIDEKKCVPPTIPHGKLIHKKDLYSEDDFAQFQCDLGYRFEDSDFIRCKNGQWPPKLPICKPTGELCSPPPRVEHAIITSAYKEQYGHGSKVQFQCKHLYKTEGEDEISCINGNWGAIPKCILSHCGSPEVTFRDAVLVSETKDLYENGSRVGYTCGSTFLKDEIYAVCINGHWQYPHCIKKDYCDKPSLSHGVLMTDMGKEKFKEGETLDYTCLGQYKPKNNGSVTCKDGQWDGPVECTRPNMQCTEPPVPENGDIRQEKVEKGVPTVIYQCQKYFTLKDTRPVKCNRGEWEPFPVCMPPCKIERIHPDLHIEDPKQPIYIPEGKKEKALRCKRDYYVSQFGWSRGVEVECQGGKIRYLNECNHHSFFG